MIGFLVDTDSMFGDIEWFISWPILDEAQEPVYLVVNLVNTGELLIEVPARREIAICQVFSERGMCSVPGIGKLKHVPFAH